MTETWTQEQKDMLFTDMTNEEIAEATGRSIAAVVSRRYQYTGHSTNLDNWKKLTFQSKRVTFGEAHLIQTAKRIGAKIMDLR